MKKYTTRTVAFVLERKTITFLRTRFRANNLVSSLHAYYNIQVYRHAENGQRERRMFRTVESNRHETVLFFHFFGAATVKIIIIVMNDK